MKIHIDDKMTFTNALKNENIEKAQGGKQNEYQYDGT